MCDETYTNGKPTVRVVVVCAVHVYLSARIVEKACATSRATSTRRSKRRPRRKKRIGEILSGSESANMHRAHPIHIVLLLVVSSLSISIHPQTRKMELFLLFIRVIFAIFSFFLSAEFVQAVAAVSARQRTTLAVTTTWTLSSKRQPHMHACMLSRQEKDQFVAVAMILLAILRAAAKSERNTQRTKKKIAINFPSRCVWCARVRT